MHNIVIGKPYIWHNGKITVACSDSGVTAEIKFHEKGWTSNNDYKVSGCVKNKEGEIIIKLAGSWISHLTAIDLRDKKEYKIVE